MANRLGCRAKTMGEVAKDFESICRTLRWQNRTCIFVVTIRKLSAERSTQIKDQKDLLFSPALYSVSTGVLNEAPLRLGEES